MRGAYGTAALSPPRRRAAAGVQPPSAPPPCTPAAQSPPPRSTTTCRRRRPRRHLLAASLTLGLTARSSLVAAQTTFTCPTPGAPPTWAINADEAYAWPSQYPQGCSCEENADATAPCPLFDCNCVCDLTAGQCDYNCCCDAECSADQVARFQALDACLPAGPAPTNVVMCYDEGSLVSVNPWGPLSAADTAQAALDNLLCVQTNNSPNDGQFYEDPGVLSSASISNAEGTGFTSYQSTITYGAGGGATEGDGTYDKGDRLPAAFQASNAMLAAYGGYLPSPSADDSGRCIETAYALFETPTYSADGGNTNGGGGGEGTVGCTRIADPATCATAFGAARLTSDLWVGAVASVQPSTAPAAGDWVAVTVSSVTYRDWNTGAESDFTARYNCDAFYYAGGGAAPAAALAACALGGGGTLAAAPAAAAPACYNALLSACYTVTHNGDGKVTKVKVAITVSDVPLAAGVADAAAAAATPDAFAARQVFTYQYASSADVAVTEAQGNADARVRSGAPGYLIGRPVLAGQAVGGGTGTVDAPQGGLKVLGGGSCADGATTSVLYGYDTLTCCTIDITKTELQDLCNGAALSPYLASDGITPAALAALPSTDTLIGSYGNADPLDATQWLGASIGAPGGAPSWSGAAATCSGVPAVLAWRFLWANVGAKANAQARIVAADASYATVDWVWRDSGGGTAATQPFLVCTTVSFVQYDADAEEYTPPPPPIAFSVPWDVFYPFYVYSGAEAAAGRVSWVATAAAAALAAAAAHLLV